MDCKIQLKTDAILNVPLDVYDLNFLFIVNGEEFKTSQIQSDLLSPIICQNHRNDPTMNTFTINTHYEGHFSYILDLINFNQISIPDNEIPFLLEVLKILQNDSINLSNLKFSASSSFDLLKKYQKYDSVFASEISEEIDKIAKNFYTFCEDQRSDFCELPIEIIERILSSQFLSLKDEDQLLSFVNYLYVKCDDDKRKDVSYLYGYVIFECVSPTKIEEFVRIFDINDINALIWLSLSNRLKLNQNGFNNSQAVNYWRGASNIGNQYHFVPYIPNMGKTTNNTYTNVRIPAPPPTPLQPQTNTFFPTSATRNRVISRFYTNPFD